MSFTLSSGLYPTQGFHTTSTTKINVSSLPSSSCTLELLYALPPLIFVDRYELALRSSSYNFSINSASGNLDLEKPVHAVEQETVELKVSVGLWDAEKEEAVVIDVPMHLRYPEAAGADSKEQQYVSVRLDWPKGVVTCSADNLASYTLTTTPIPPERASSADYAHDTIRVPSGRKSDLTFVETGTAVTILVCFFWLLRVSLRTSKRLVNDKFNKER
ncbi:hypothetical protein BDQ17DRAFT_1345116 [Cyathus striatus]|nr:hypothetical protein BDQ17DRAFT_1345116 [Cyathus striatus]